MRCTCNVLYLGECEVYLDLNDVDGVKDMGIHSWIQEKIELSQFVVILCSTGARYKCGKKKMKMKQEREVRFMRPNFSYH